MLQMMGSGHTAAQDFFADPEHVDDLYGLDDETNPNNPNDPIASQANNNEHLEENRPHVTVPDINCPFNDIQLATLREQVNPLTDIEGDPHGIHLFEETLSLLG